VPREHLRVEDDGLSPSQDAQPLHGAPLHRSIDRVFLRGSSITRITASSARGSRGHGPPAAEARHGRKHLMCDRLLLTLIDFRPQHVEHECVALTTKKLASSWFSRLLMMSACVFDC
jgi:hypothetical protein